MRLLLIDCVMSPRAAALLMLTLAVSGSAAAATGSADFSLTYDQDFMRVVSGRAGGNGAAPGMLQFDGLFRSRDDKFKVALLGTFGGSIADRLGALQTTAWYDAYNTFQVYQLWYEHRFGDSGVSIRIGLQDYAGKFDTLDVVKRFLNASLFLQPTINQVSPSTFPTTTLGAVAKWQSPFGFYLLGGIYDGVPGLPGHPHGTHVALNDGDGAFSDLEIGIDGKRRYKIGVGVWYRTAHFTDPAGRARDQNHGVYLFGGMRAFGDKSRPTLYAFVELGSARPNRNKLHRYIGAGLRLTHFVPRRPNDALSFAIARARPTDLFKQVESRAATAETIFELTYRAQLTSAVALQPDVQYVVQPGARINVENAWVVGLRIQYKI